MEVLSRIAAIFFMQIVLFFMALFVTGLLVAPFLNAVIGAIAVDNLLLQGPGMSLMLNVVSLAAATWFTLQTYAANSVSKNFKNLLAYVEIPTVILGLTMAAASLVGTVIGPGGSGIGQPRNDYVLLVIILLPAITFPLTALFVTKLFLRSRLGQPPNLGKK